MDDELTFKRILVTGGCGFIGANFIRHILNKYPEYEIINLDALTYAGNPANLEDLESNANYSFLLGDICDGTLVRRVTGECDAIVHFAAESHVDRSLENAETFIQTNVIGTHRLLEAVMDRMKNGHSDRFQRFIMISTDEVYGDIPVGNSSTENDNLLPRNPYSASKACADRLAYSYFKTFNLPIIITRSSNNFGPYQYPEKLIPLFVTNLLEKKKVPLYGDGNNIRDWIHVEDNCEAIDRILHRGINGDVYNIGGGNELKNIDITEKILNIFGKDESWVDYVKDRKGHDRRYSMDCSKVSQEFDWKPRHAFDDALKATVDWYEEQTSWWKEQL